MEFIETVIILKVFGRFSQKVRCRETTTFFLSKKCGKNVAFFFQFQNAFIYGHMAFTSIMEDIVQDRKARLARDVKRDETLDCVVEYVWSDAAPVFTGTLETYCKENKDNLIDKMNKGHLITFNHPDSEAQDPYTY